MEQNIQRKSYGEMLVELGNTDKRICVLDADLGKSTMGCLFKEAHPERYFEMGIAEQNMMSTAAGLSLTGKIPFVNSFAVFATGRTYDQLRQTISIAKLNVKVCGSSAGLSDFGDGSTHQSVEDIAIMRAIPNLTVLSPVDAIECAQMVKYMVDNEGPMYIRVNRNPLPPITKQDEAFDIKKMAMLRDGGDIVIFATGVMVSRALDAADMLAKEGVSARVVNISVIKPLNAEKLIEYAKGMKGVVTAEEHSRIGGLGSAVVEALREHPVKTEFVAIDDKFGTSAHGYDELLAYYNLTAQAVYDAAKKLL